MRKAADLKEMIFVEVWEADPFGSSCCGIGSRILSKSEAEQFVKSIREIESFFKQVDDDYKDSIKLKRELVTSKKFDYPSYVLELKNVGFPLPYFFLDGKPAFIGRIPKYEEFASKLEEKGVIKKEQII